MINNTNNSNDIIANNNDHKLVDTYNHSVNADFFKTYNFYINKIIVENDLCIDVVFINKITTRPLLFELRKNLYKNTTILTRNGIEYKGEEKQLFINKLKSSINKLFKF